jgi:hypothetical protein
MKLLSLRRSNETYEPVGQSDDDDGAESQGLSKWEQRLERAAVEQGAGPSSSLRKSDPTSSTAVTSPRGLDDKADPSIQKFRSSSQVRAMAELYITNPKVFA